MTDEDTTKRRSRPSESRVREIIRDEMRTNCPFAEELRTQRVMIETGFSEIRKAQTDNHFAQLKMISELKDDHAASTGEIKQELATRTALAEVDKKRIDDIEEDAKHNRRTSRATLIGFFVSIALMVVAYVWEKMKNGYVGPVILIAILAFCGASCTRKIPEATEVSERTGEAVGDMSQTERLVYYKGQYEAAKAEVNAARTARIQWIAWIAAGACFAVAIASVAFIFLFHEMRKTLLTIAAAATAAALLCIFLAQAAPWLPTIAIVVGIVFLVGIGYAGRKAYLADPPQKDGSP